MQGKRWAASVNLAIKSAQKLNAKIYRLAGKAEETVHGPNLG